MTRALAAAAILASTGVALAAALSAVAPAPPVAVIRPPASTAGSATITLTNGGSAAVTVGELVPDGTCAAGVTTTPSVALPFTLAGSAARGVEVTCAPTAAVSIRRCQFHARTPTHAPLADYTALCVSPAQAALTIAPAGGVAFGEVPLGTQRTLTVTLTNPGATAVTAESIDVADQAGDFQIGSPCPTDGPRCDASAAMAAGGGTLAVDVRCSPTQLGARTTQLYAVTSSGGAVGPYAVTCTGVAGAAGPSLSLATPSVDLGDVPVATGSASSAVAVTNIGSSDLHISAIAIVGGATSDWTFAASSPCAQAPCTLAAGASIEIAVAFAPSALGSRHSTLQLDSDDASHPISTVTLDGNGLGATLAVAAAGDPGVGSGVDLGSVAVGASAAFTLALRDDGNAALGPVTLSIAQTDTAFAIDPDATTIPASTAVTATITCAPPDHLAYTGTLTITAPTALTGSPIAIPLACVGTTGSLVATPSPLQLGEIRVGAGVTTQTITLTTLGPTVAITTGPTLAAPLTGVTLGALSATSVAAAAPATFTIAVDPQADQVLADHVSLTAGAQALDLPITGAVVTAAVTPSVTRDLGSFCVGQPTATATVSLTASGTASIGLPAPPVMVLGDSSPFQLAPVSPSVFPFTLPAGARATAQVTAKRQALAGTVTDQVEWTDDIAGAAPPETTINATFIGDGGAISPGAVDFGAAPIHLTEPTDQVITIQNCGTEAITLAAPVIAPAGGFFTLGTLPEALLPAQTATFTVGFGPVAVQGYAATLTVPATQGSATVPLVVALSGSGEITTPVGDDAGVGPHAGSSGCGCDSRPGGGGLALAGLCAPILLRRRRTGSGTLERCG